MKRNNKVKVITIVGFELVAAIFLILVLAIQTILRGSFIFESLVSFLPYYLVAILFIVFGIITINKITKIVNLGIIALLILSLIVSASILLKIEQFAWQNNPKISEINSSTEGQRLRIASFNKLFTNDNYTEIDQALSDLQPDVIGFAEFTSQDAQQIKSLQNYPYKLLSRNFPKPPGNIQMIYSKYPFLERSTELDNNLPFASVRIQFPDAQIRIISIHTAAPINQNFYLLRGKQLNLLADYLKRHQSENFLLMGDFNLTPWSPDYMDFVNKLPKNTVNLGQGRGFQFTWGLDGGSLVRLQIDQMFLHQNANAKLETSGLQVAGNYGSDHELVYTDLII